MGETALMKEGSAKHGPGVAKSNSFHAVGPHHEESEQEPATAHEIQVNELETTENETKKDATECVPATMLRVFAYFLIMASGVGVQYTFGVILVQLQEAEVDMPIAQCCFQLILCWTLFEDSRGDRYRSLKGSELRCSPS